MPRTQRNLEKPIDVLTPSQVKALVLLSRYRYLNVNQMSYCGVGKNARDITNYTLYRLTKRPKDNLVFCQSYFGVSHSFGKMPYIYTLTKNGADRVAELMGVDFDQIRFPAGKVQYINDYYHRTAYIDFCIEVDKWAAQNENREVLSMTHYFDKNGANRLGKPSKSVNRLSLSDEIGDIEPDGLFYIDTGEKRRAFAVEVHNKTDTKRIVNQLARHTFAINSGAISKHLNHDKASFVLSVSMTPEQKALVQQRVLTISDFERFNKLFVFSDIETIKAKGFELAFSHANGEFAPIFQTAS